MDDVGLLLDELHQGLLALQARHEAIGDVRGGRGLMCALELVADRATKKPADKAVPGKVQAIAYQAGAMVRVSGPNIILSPPLVITEAELALWRRARSLQHEIIMVDDGSTDSSWKVIETLRSKNEHIRGIKFQRNYGKSAALNEGFKAASGDVVITMDADMQDSPDEIPELRRMVIEGNYDIVSGWKKKRYDNTLTKNIPSKLFNAAARSMSKIKLHDFNCGLKAYKKKVVKSIEVYGEMHRYVPVLAKWAGFRNITEKVVEHREIGRAHV